MSGEDLYDARRKLVEALGENENQYFQQMKLWFHMKLSKQEFDIEARKLLSGSSSKIQLHNMFLLYLFRKCQGLASSPVQPQHSHHSSKTSGKISSNSSSKNKDQRHSRSDKVAFEVDDTNEGVIHVFYFSIDSWVVFLKPADILDYAYVAKTSTKHTEEPPIRYCAQELFIPNTSLIMGRLLLATWEHDLEGADDKCADILGVAVKIFLTHYNDEFTPSNSNPPRNLLLEKGDTGEWVQSIKAITRMNISYFILSSMSRSNTPLCYCYEVYPHLRGKRVEGSFGKNHPSVHPTEIRHYLLIVGSLVYCESSVLDHAATEA
ncbi:unnamed protein product, partial [Timema podura]|nr:unnamed protein product [Timema podura]